MPGGHIKVGKLGSRRRRNLFQRGGRRRKWFISTVGLCALIITLIFGGLYIANAQENRSYTGLRVAAERSLKPIYSPSLFDGLTDEPAPEVAVEPEPENPPPSKEVALVEAPDPNAPPRIYLTFDDGPSALSTPKILEILAQYNVKATFFVLGTQAEARPEMVKAAADAGHVIANHGYSHDYASVYASPEAFMQDLHQCEDILTGILGSPPKRIMRFIGGTTVSQLEYNPGTRDAIMQALVAEGWRYFDWNADLYDSISGPGPAQGVLGSQLNTGIDEKISYGIKDIVVLAHDTNARTWTPADLPMIIEHCKAKGYTFEVLSGSSPECAFR